MTKLLGWIDEITDEVFCYHCGKDLEVYKRRGGVEGVFEGEIGRVYEDSLSCNQCGEEL